MLYNMPVHSLKELYSNHILHDMQVLYSAHCPPPQSSSLVGRRALTFNKSFALKICVKKVWVIVAPGWCLQTANNSSEIQRSELRYKLNYVVDTPLASAFKSRLR